MTKHRNLLDFLKSKDIHPGQVRGAEIFRELRDVWMQSTRVMVEYNGQIVNKKEFLFECLAEDPYEDLKERFVFVDHGYGCYRFERIGGPDFLKDGELQKWVISFTSESEITDKIVKFYLPNRKKS